jgi:hypothetical protein
LQLRSLLAKRCRAAQDDEGLEGFDQQALQIPVSNRSTGIQALSLYYNVVSQFVIIGSVEENECTNLSYELVSLSSIRDVASTRTQTAQVHDGQSKVIDPWVSMLLFLGLMASYKTVMIDRADPTHICKAASYSAPWREAARIGRCNEMIDSCLSNVRMVNWYTGICCSCPLSFQSSMSFHH